MTTAAGRHHQTWAMHGVAIGLFAASAWLTATMASAPMQGHELSVHDAAGVATPWMPAPGGRRLDAAVAFLAMWSPMMVAMMLPAAYPELWKYHRALRIGHAPNPNRLAAVAGLGYLAYWTAVGIAVFVLGAAAMASGTHHHAPDLLPSPLVAGVVLAAGVIQLTDWKARCLALCRAAPQRHAHAVPGVHSAWVHGLRHGLHCSLCSGALMAAWLAVGMMDLQAMVLVTIAITAERVLPGGGRVARVSGAALIATGLVLLGQVVSRT
ncbi:hypothetical protein TBR22_A08960 [Luteitalea sp. TBR-22]|uniref:DUF2182 domain-containing protein n=1 Tax=Luteitalea sp. TBR-22 TaxID=2802971 RepID=UPI001EF417F7|nr:DUF2182 domain-containing protein [Luteitalea sp. TBR-22]BCS31693.2 hypothetical protein TBR22_A08960 [Luteitalea sp. TBR-22]